MNAMIAPTFVAGAFFALAFFWFARTMYRLVMFHLTATHRETILNGAALLDDEHHLSDVETRSVAVAVRHLYDYKIKKELARGTYDYVRLSMSLPQPKKMREEVRQVSRAFATLVLAENPFYALLIIKTMINRRAIAAKVGPVKQSVVSRAEITLASRLPTIDEDICHPAIA